MRITFGRSSKVSFRKPSSSGQRLFSSQYLKTPSPDLSGFQLLPKSAVLIEAMVFISCPATALRKREIKASKSTSVASWPGFTFAGFVSWAAAFFLGGVVQPPAPRANTNKTKAKNLAPAFIGDTFVSFSREWQATLIFMSEPAPQSVALPSHFRPRVLVGRDSVEPRSCHTHPGCGTDGHLAR